MKVYRLGLLVMFAILIACNQQTSTPPTHNTSTRSLMPRWNIQWVTDLTGRRRGAGNISLALDSNNLPVMSYFDAEFGELKLVHCGNPTCSSGNSIQGLTSIALDHSYHSMVLDASGNPVISYITNTLELKLIHCGNANCTSSNSNQIVTTNVAYDLTSLVLDAAGNPIISYVGGSFNPLMLVHCGNANCSSGNNIQMVDGTVIVNSKPSLILDASGNPVISYVNSLNNDLILMRCSNANCSSSNDRKILVNDAGSQHVLKLDSLGRPIIVYVDNTTNLHLKFVHCVVSDCLNVNIIQSGNIESNVYLGDMVIGNYYNPIISYRVANSNTLKILYCSYIICNYNNSIETIARTSSDNKIVLDSYGNPVISYFNEVLNFLKLARLSDTIPPTASPTEFPVSNALGWHNSDVTITWNWADNVGGSGIDTANCPSSSTLIGVGTLAASVSCKDLLENIDSASYIIRVDKTAPALNPVVTPNSVFLYGSVSVNAGATDDLSGLASLNCGGLPDTSSVGIKTVLCSASDNADNTASSTAEYNVIYNFSGFQLPVQNFPSQNQITAGWVIPFEFNLGGYSNPKVVTQTDSFQVPCNAGKVPFEAPQAAKIVELSDLSLEMLEKQNAQGWGLNTKDILLPGQYRYLWLTSAVWTNTCRQFNLRLNDGTVHSATFRFM